MTREFSSTFTRINRQTSIPTEKCFKLAQKPCSRVGEKKYNLNGISTALRRHFNFVENSSPFLRFLDYSYWPVRDLELALRDAANVHTVKKNTRLFKSDEDVKTGWQENLLMLTAVLFWCHQLSFKW